jgi:23S rRNA pseudouridine1911/1915/1917 synthase
MNPRIQREIAVPAALSGRRLDQVAAELFPEFSRSRLQRWIREACLLVDGAVRIPRDAVHGGEWLRLDAESEVEGDWRPTEMELPVVHEDEHIIVIDKPAGLVVHPAAGHADDTLLNGLLAAYPELAQVPRAGIVHRLDRDTTGLLVVARTLAAQTALVAALQRRDVSREYRAVVNGVPVSGATVDRPIGRHPRDRQRMAVLESGGREAVTHYRVLERFRAHACLAVQLETGRTHQIRVHLSEAGFPVTGDPDYGGRVRLPKQAAPGLVDALRAFRRQALHAFRLSFVHPGSGETIGFEAPVPEDMQCLLSELRADREEFLHGG